MSFESHMRAVKWSGNKQYGLKINGDSVIDFMAKFKNAVCYDRHYAGLTYEQYWKEKLSTNNRGAFTRKVLIRCGTKEAIECLLSSSVNKTKTGGTSLQATITASGGETWYWKFMDKIGSNKGDCVDVPFTYIVSEDPNVPDELMIPLNVVDPAHKKISLNTHSIGKQWSENCRARLIEVGCKDFEPRPRSNDRGADEIGKTRSGRKFVAQYKKGICDRRATQEVFTASALYKTDIAMILTDGNITRQAQEDARELGILIFSSDNMNKLEESLS